MLKEESKATNHYKHALLFLKVNLGQEFFDSLIIFSRQ
jgi:hypothetical protein